jgi:hypothetical protein
MAAATIVDTMRRMKNSPIGRREGLHYYTLSAGLKALHYFK